MKQILVVTAVEAEREAIVRSLHEQTNIEVIAAGVGSAAAAAAAHTAQGLVLEGSVSLWSSFGYSLNMLF